jgi:anti-anti-sigma factor
VILAPALGVAPAEEPEGRVPGWLRQFPFPGGARLVIVLTGDADLSTSAQLRDQLGAAVSQAPEQLVVDVSDVAFLDLSGLDVLYEVALAALALGGTVSVRGLSPLLWWLHARARGRAVPVG